MTLKEFFEEYPKTALALSGGIDSSYLLYAGRNLGADIKPYFVKSMFQPEFELEDAIRLCEYVGVKLTVITADVFSNDDIIKNPEDRCYFCKNVIFSKIISSAKADGYNFVLDGTNASDDAGDRPGMRALEQMSVLSPLRICGITKSQIRSLAKQGGLFNWDKPSYACLATRIPTGTRIEKDDILKISKAEEYLFSLGFSDFRVRLIGDSVKIQMPEDQMPKLLNKRAFILNELRGFKDIFLDLKAR